MVGDVVGGRAFVVLQWGWCIRLHLSGMLNHEVPSELSHDMRPVTAVCSANSSMDTPILLQPTRNGISFDGLRPLWSHHGFGAANAEEAVLVTDLQPLPSPGRERTSKRKELQLAMEWVIARSRAQGAL